MTTVDERLDKTRGLANLSSYNEEQAKTAIIIPVLESLGWETDNRDQVVPELPLKPLGKDEGQNHVDYCLRISGANEVFIEAKRPGVNLGKWEGELLRYVSAYGVPLAVLTTGLEWWLYLPLKKGAWQEKRFAVIDVHKDHDAANQLTAFLSRRAVLDGSAFQEAEKAIIDKNLPRVWNELYLEQRDSLIESLGTKLRDQTGYEPLRPHLEYFLDRQVGASSDPTQRISGTPQDTGSANPFRPGSRFAQIYDALLEGLPNQRGIEELARRLGVDPGNARRAFQRGHGGIGDLGRWRLTVEGDIERLIPETPQLTSIGPDAPLPPVAIRPLLEEIRNAVTGPGFPKAEWYATQTPDYRAKVVLSDDLYRVFVRVTWAKDWVWVNLKDVGKYKVSKLGEVGSLGKQIQVAYQKADQHLLRSVQSSGSRTPAGRKLDLDQVFRPGTNNDRIYSILKDGAFHDMGELAAVASSGLSTAKAVVKYFARVAPSKWNFQVEQQSGRVRIVQLDKRDS